MKEEIIKLLQDSNLSDDHLSQLKKSIQDFTFVYYIDGLLIDFDGDKEALNQILNNYINHINNTFPDGVGINYEMVKHNLSTSAAVLKKLSWMNQFIKIGCMNGPIGIQNVAGNDRAYEAVSRKLQASWTIETMQDLTSIHGIDIVKEIQTAISREVCYEFETMIFNIINEKSRVINSLDDVKFIVPNSPDIDTHRLVIIASESFLNSSEFLEWVKQKANPVTIIKDVTNPIFAYIDDNTAGIYFNPYILLIDKMIINAQSSEPMLSLGTRYGLIENNIQDHFCILK